METLNVGRFALPVAPMLLLGALLVGSAAAFAFADQGEAPATVRTYLASQGLTLADVLLDPGFAMSRQTDAHVFPTTLFFDGQGVLVDRHMGELSAATLAARREQMPRGKSGNLENRSC